MAVAHVTKRSTFGVLLADRQAVQFMLAECASQLYIGRLMMLLHIAYKAEKGMDLTQENSIAKVYLAHMVHKVIDNRDPVARRARLQPGYPTCQMVHASALAAAGRRSRRSAQMEGWPQRHQGVPRARHHRVGRRRRFALNFRSSFRGARQREPGIWRLLAPNASVSGFRVRCFASPRNDESTTITSPPFPLSTACQTDVAAAKPSGQWMRSTA